MVDVFFGVCQVRYREEYILHLL